MMGLFFRTSKGTWWIQSRLDPRWNLSGSGSVGMGYSRDAEKALDQLKAKLGEPPKDLEWGYMKD